MLYLYESVAEESPQRHAEITGGPAEWSELLDNPLAVGSKAERKRGYALTGARYWPTAESFHKENIEAVTCLVLDVDAAPVPEEALRTALDGLHAIVYTSPSHTAAAPRWRVLLPLASPLAPKKHRSLVQQLSENLVPGFPGCIDTQSTGDPGRLGFVKVTLNPDDYGWFVLQGVNLDWTVFDLDDDPTWGASRGVADVMQRSPLWSGRSAALKAASKRYEAEGVGLQRGQGRTILLWKVAMNLWWAWAAEDDDFVLTVLRLINDNFADQEPDEELQRKAAEAWTRTVSEARNAQVTGSYGWEREPKASISSFTLKEHAKRLLRRTGKKDAVVGDAVRRMAKGETLSDDPETWRGLVTSTAHSIARAFAFETAERITSFFRPSLATMRAAGVDIPEDAVLAIVENKLKSAKKQQEDIEERQEIEKTEQIKISTNGERDNKYTPQEVSSWKATVGLSDSTWLLAKDHLTYVFSNGTWVGPYTEHEFNAQGRKDLLTASDFVTTQTFDEKTGKWKQISVDDLLHKHGVTIDVVRHEMWCDKTWLDGRTLVVKGPSRNAIDSKYHAQVDSWLRVMCGRSAASNKEEAKEHRKGDPDDFDNLCDWLACLTEVRHPCAALYLQGPRNVGKGLFTDGIGKIWKAGHVDIEDAFHDFNSMLAETPLVRVDEGLPTNVKASQLLRRAIAQREHVLKIKNRTASKLTGCIRLVFTANNLDLFNKSQEVLKKEDVDALAQRFIHIMVRPESEQYLQLLGKKHRDFVEKNLLAEHTLWLHDQRWQAVKARGERFLVVGNNTTVSDVIATNGDGASDVCAVVAGLIVERIKAPWFIIQDKKIHVSLSGLCTHLSLQNTTRRYTERQVASGLHALSKRGSHCVRFGTKVMRVWDVDLKMLRAWCDNTGVRAWEDVEQALGLGAENPPAQQPSI